MAWTTPERIGRMQFSPSGLLLATTNLEAIENDSEDTVRLWDVLTGKEVAHLVDISQVFALSFPSERELVLIEEKGIRLWDSISGDVRKVINKTSNGGAVVLGGKVVVLSTRNGEVLVVDLPTGKIRHRLWPPADTENWYDELDASDRHLAAVCRADRDEYKLLVLWDVERGKRLRTYDIGDWDFGPVAVHPEGSLVAADVGDKIRSFGLDNEEELEGFTTYTCKRVHDLRYSSDGRTLLVLCEKGMVRLDALSGKVLSTFKLPATIRWSGGLIDPNGEKVAVTSDQEIEVLDLIDA